MLLKNIKLIISDMDGTLLNSSHEVSATFLDLFEQLKQHNIIFVAASGRPHYSIESKLNTIKKDIIIAGENGGVVTYKNNNILISGLSKSSIAIIDKNVTKLTNSHQIFCTRFKAYLKRSSASIIPSVKEYYKNYEFINDVNEIKDDVIKIAIYNEAEAEINTYPYLKHLESSFKIKLSGKNWVDISDSKTNKGIALQTILEKFNISRKEVLAFGDYKNDIEMLKMSGVSVAMQNAHENVKSVCKYETLSNDNLGVETVIKNLIAQKKHIRID